MFRQFPSNDNIQSNLLEYFEITKQWKKLIELYFHIYSKDISKENFLIHALEISIDTDNEYLILEKIKDMLIIHPNNKILLSTRKVGRTSRYTR